MNLFLISSLLVCFVSIGFGSFIVSGNWNSKLQRSWFYVSALISVWSLCLYGVTSADNPNTALAWQYLLDISALFVPAVYFDFIQQYLQKFFPKLTRISYVMAVILSLISVTPIFRAGMTQKFGYFWIEPGPWYPIFPAYYAFFVIFCLWLLLKTYSSSEDTDYKNRIKYQMLATIIGFSGAFTNFFPQLFNLYPFGNYFIIVYVIFMGYSVLRFHALNVKSLIAELFIGAINIAFIFNLLLSETWTDWLIRSLLLTIIFIFSWLLYKNVQQEVLQREKIEKLASELEKANTQLTEFDKQKSEFVSIASHQLRSPLTAIKGYASMLLENSYGQLSEKQREPVDRIFLSAESLVIVIENFLNISRIEQGRMHYEMEPINLLDLAKGAVDQLMPNAIKKGLAMDFTVKGTGPLTASIDKEKVRQCYLNFIDNAIKYTRTGAIHVTIERMNGDIRFAVADSGIGMKPETLARLFQKFSRADDASKTNAGGAGLGLFLASEIVKAHKGKVWAESAGQEKGSTFFIELPAM